jgi:hypothetical protein
MSEEEQIIYFDEEDERMDGLGWNVVSEGGTVALRFATKHECINWCQAHGLPYTWKKRNEQHGCI